MFSRLSDFLHSSRAFCGTAAILAVSAACGPARGVAAAPPPVVDATQHEATLRRAEAALRPLERADVSRRAAKSIALGLARPLTLRRRDGATQLAGGDEWTRRAGQMATNPSRQDERALRQAIAGRRAALEEWTRPRDDGSFYQPADAQRIVRDLESSGQIRVGPTRIQQIWEDIKKAYSDFIDRIGRWLFGAAPSAPTSVPKIDPRWITFFFYSTVLSLLALIGYFLWKALGGRWSREGARREVRFLGGEDAELLVLPPDELRERAARLAAVGDFRGALRHLYVALLLELDARGVWRYDARRTNWEHIGALRRSANASLAGALVEPLSDITRRFDRVRYGDAPASQDDWTRFAHDVAALEQTVAGNSINTTSNSNAGSGTNGTSGGQSAANASDSSAAQKRSRAATGSRR